MECKDLFSNFAVRFERAQTRKTYASMKSAQNLRLDITLTNYIIRMKKMTINGESLGGSQQGCLAVAQFLKDNYQFRRNVLNGKVE